MKNTVKSLLISWVILVLVFTIVLLAFWPGIISPDAMVQWHQVQTGVIDNWHRLMLLFLCLYLLKFGIVRP